MPSITVKLLLTFCFIHIIRVAHAATLLGYKEEPLDKDWLGSLLPQIGDACQEVVTVFLVFILRSGKIENKAKIHKLTQEEKQKKLSLNDNLYKPYL